MNYEEARKQAEATLAAKGYRDQDACANCLHGYGDEDGQYICQRVQFTWVYPGRPPTTTDLPVDASGICNEFQGIPKLKAPEDQGGEGGTNG
jgi:hypothetical protein